MYIYIYIYIYVYIYIYLSVSISISISMTQLFCPLLHPNSYLSICVVWCLCSSIVA